MVYNMFDPKLLEGVKTVHFIGCGGSGTYPLIQILHSRGFAITGSDVEETKNTEAERALGVKVMIGHDAANVGDADLVVYSARSMMITRNCRLPGLAVSRPWNAACCWAMSAVCIPRLWAWPVPMAKPRPPA